MAYEFLNEGGNFEIINKQDTMIRYVDLTSMSTSSSEIF
jgi:hypothetical protein